MRAHAEGKARSVHRDGAITLGVDTEVVLDDRVYGKPADREDAAHMLNELAGRTHIVVSGLCLLGDGLELVQHELTDVTFRLLSPRARRTRTSRAASGRAAPARYAIQGLGGRLVERIEGDYLNVVGLPGALLISLLAAPTRRVLLFREKP